MVTLVVIDSRAAVEYPDPTGRGESDRVAVGTHDHVVVTVAGDVARGQAPAELVSGLRAFNDQIGMNIGEFGTEIEVDAADVEILAVVAVSARGDVIRAVAVEITRRQRIAEPFAAGFARERVINREIGRHSAAVDVHPAGIDKRRPVGFISPDHDIGNPVVIEVAPGQSYAEVIGVGAAGENVVDDRIRCRASVEEIGRAGVGRRAVIKRRAHQEILDTVTVEITGRRERLAKKRTGGSDQDEVGDGIGGEAAVVDVDFARRSAAGIRRGRADHEITIPVVVEIDRAEGAPELVARRLAVDIAHPLISGGKSGPKQTDHHRAEEETVSTCSCQRHTKVHKIKMLRRSISDAAC